MKDIKKISSTIFQSESALPRDKYYHELDLLWKIRGRLHFVSYTNFSESFLNFSAVSIRNQIIWDIYGAHYSEETELGLH